MTDQIKFTQQVIINGSYDYRRHESGKNYGISDALIQFNLIGPKGAVHFIFETGWYTNDLQKHVASFGLTEKTFQPSGRDLGYHSPIPMYEGQDIAQENCQVLNGPCYSDGSGLRAAKWLPNFISGGTEWLWPQLEEEYKMRFEQ